jgi:hypothetical protein
MNLFGSKQTETLKSFDQVRNYLNKIENINTGGCGISTLAMYRWLKKHGYTNEYTAFYFLENDENNHKNNKEYFTNKEIKLKAPCHIVLYHNDQTIDSRGFYYISRYEYKLLENSEEFLLAMINNISSWNWRFDRKTNVKKIAKTLQIDLSDIEY